MQSISFILIFICFPLPDDENFRWYNCKKKKKPVLVCFKEEAYSFLLDACESQGYSFVMEMNVFVQKQIEFCVFEHLWLA